MASVENLSDRELLFSTNDGKKFKLYHAQDCCENVSIESVVGDLADLVGEPMLIAEESTSNQNSQDCKQEDLEYQDSFTWTFYKFATRKGYVDVRWYGESNGYYSEAVYFTEV